MHRLGPKPKPENNRNNSPRDYSKIGKNIRKGALKTLGWIAAPEIMATTLYNKKYGELHSYNPMPEFGIFFLTTALTIGATVGTNKIHDNLVNKDYTTKNATVEIKHDSESDNIFLDIASYGSPLAKLILMKTSKDITHIKTVDLDIIIENTNVIKFDKTSGYILNKEAYYNNDFLIKDKEEDIFEEHKWTRYHQKELTKINFEYEKLRQESAKIREEALNDGNIGKITALEKNLAKLQEDYEFKRSEIKKTQISVEKKLTNLVDQLNIEYFAYKNAPKDTAIPGRDYNLSDIKKQN